MANRERYQSQYDRDEHRSDQRDDGGYRRGRDWEPRESYRAQGFDRRDYRDDDQRNYGESRFRDDRDYGRDWEYESRSPSDYGYGLPQSRRSPNYYGYGATYEPRHDERDEGRGRHFERGQTVQGYYREQWPSEAGGGRFGSHYGEPSYRQSNYNYGARGTPESYGQRAWPGRHGGEGQEGQRGRDEGNWMQHLRDAGQHLARNVKRMFRGPKGYKRSDERIHEDVSDRLGQHDRLDCSEVEVTVSNGEVTLTGSVLSRHEKFLVEEIADDVSGVNDVHNQLRIRREQTAPSTGLSGESSTGPSAGQNPTEAARNRNARA